LIEPSDLNEAAVSGEPVVVLSWSFWQREFGGDPGVIGRSLTADLVPLTIVGVAPEGFKGLSIALEHDITVPITLIPAISQSEASMIAGTSSWVAVTGRLRDGTALEQARAQLQALWPGVLADSAPQQFITSQREEYLKRTLAVDAGATGLERGLRLRYARALNVLLGIAGIVVLIAGANLCALVYTRAEARRHELAVRLALGSSRGRLIRELTLEGLIVGAIGTAGGIALAAIASDGLMAFLLRDYIVRTAFDASPDRLIAAFASISGIGMQMTVTAIAAWMATRHAVALSAGSRTVARSASAGRLLVGTQIALAIVLLAHASLLLRSVAAMASDDRALWDGVVLAYPTERVGKYRTLDPALYYAQALERVRAVPGVEASAFITFKPQGGATPFELAGRAGTPIADSDVTAEFPQVSPGFFDTMRIPLLRGRDFTFADAGSAPKVAIISETLEQRVFGPGKGLGQRVRISRRPEWQEALVVGIARDTPVFDVRGGNVSIVYTPAVQTGSLANWKFLVTRAPEQALPAIQRAIDALGVEYLRRFQTLDDARGRTILQERVLAGLCAFFGALALLLVSAGTYGLLSYALSLRRKEIGIRLALGADARSMARAVVFDGLAIAAIGIAIGMAGALASVPLLRSVLIDVSPYDPIAIGAACVALITVTLAASLAPAARAARVEPLLELRQD
jgi:predicted permease